MRKVMLFGQAGATLLTQAVVLERASEAEA